MIKILEKANIGSWDVRSWPSRLRRSGWYRLAMTATDCHWLPQIVIIATDCQRLQQTNTNCPDYHWTAMDCYRLQHTPTDCHWLQENLHNNGQNFPSLSKRCKNWKVAICCQMLPFVAICCHLLPFIAKSYHLLPNVAICCQKLVFVTKSWNLLPKVTICCHLLPKGV